MFWVYILQNRVGQVYIGHTQDLALRIFSHNRSDKILGKFTRKNGPWNLVWSEQHLDRASAMRRERQIKSWKSRKRIESTLLLSAKKSVVESRQKSGLTDWS